jgi:hypothetical protein
MKDPEKTIREAVKEASGILGEYLHPGERDCEATIQKLLSTLDNNDVAEALLESDEMESHRSGGSNQQRLAAQGPH